MVSLESMMLRLADPKAYYLFYEYFYKAAVGEKTWKDCMHQDPGIVESVVSHKTKMSLI